jgi:LCP family protein required for cell wall assembly
MLEDFGEGSTDEQGPPSGEEPPKRRHRGRRIAIVGFALVVLLVVGVVAGYGAFLNHTVNKNVQREALLPTPSPGESVPTRAAEAGKSQNILLIGSDERPGQSRQRSDVIILVHLTSDRRIVYLVHFPRDLFVDIPGHGKNKINASYAFGGAPLLVKTVQGLVDVPIDHVAHIGFEGFKRMTDAVGGVNVYAEEPSHESTGDIHKGMNHLNGEQALAFVRERHQLSEGDISRGRRQQAFLKALLLEALSKSTLTNPVKFAHFVDAATRNLTVDNSFSTGDLRSEALSLRHVRGNDVVFITAPFTGFGTSPDGQSIDIVDKIGMNDLGFALRTDDFSTYPVGDQVP